MLTDNDLQNISKLIDIKITKLKNEIVNVYLKPIKQAVTKVKKEEHTTTGFLDRRDLWMMKRIDKLEVKAGVEHPPQNF